jgi:hypothetical protein
MLRVAKHYSGIHVDWFSVLAIVTEETLASLLKRSGLEHQDAMPVVVEFLKRQRLVTEPELLGVIQHHIDRNG